MEIKDKDEELKQIMAETEVLLSKITGLIRVYKGLQEGEIKAKVHIEKDSAVRVRILNPEMTYEPVEVFEFKPEVSVGEAFKTIVNSEELRKKIIKEVGDSLVRLAELQLASIKLLFSNNKDW
jgi:hypothetical protein